MAVITLNGLLNYDPTLLDGMHLPNEIDPDTLKDLLLMKSWDLELLWPQPEFMKRMVASWSAGHLWEWQKLVDTKNLKYNPIWNKDVTDSEIIDRDTNGNQSGSGTNSANGTSTDSTNAFNGGAYADREKNEDQTFSQWNDQRKADEKQKTVRTYVSQGNQGITSSQQLVREEKDLAAMFNIYEIIADEFVQVFCICVY